jgi:hypothetical protein
VDFIDLKGVDSEEESCGIYFDFDGFYQSGYILCW